MGGEYGVWLGRRGEESSGKPEDECPQTVGFSGTHNITVGIESSGAPQNYIVEPFVRAGLEGVELQRELRHDCRGARCAPYAGEVEGSLDYDQVGPGQPTPSARRLLRPQTRQHRVPGRLYRQHRPLVGLGRPRRASREPSATLRAAVSRANAMATCSEDDRESKLTPTCRS